MNCWGCTPPQCVRIIPYITDFVLLHVNTKTWLNGSCLRSLHRWLVLHGTILSWQLISVLKQLCGSEVLPAEAASRQSLTVKVRFSESYKWNHWNRIHLTVYSTSGDLVLKLKTHFSEKRQARHVYERASNISAGCTKEEKVKTA